MSLNDIIEREEIKWGSLVVKYSMLVAIGEDFYGKEYMLPKC